MSIQIIPAIDLLDGSCVRLLHGDFDKCKVYELDAVRLAANAQISVPCCAYSVRRNRLCRPAAVSVTPRISVYAWKTAPAA